MVIEWSTCSIKMRLRKFSDWLIWTKLTSEESTLMAFYRSFFSWPCWFSQETPSICLTSLRLNRSRRWSRFSKSLSKREESQWGCLLILISRASRITSLSRSSIRSWKLILGTRFQLGLPRSSKHNFLILTKSLNTWIWPKVQGLDWRS